MDKKIVLQLKWIINFNWIIDFNLFFLKENQIIQLLKMFLSLLSLMKLCFNQLDMKYFVAITKKNFDKHKHALGSKFKQYLSATISVFTCVSIKVEKYII